jgi:hypothetical protein
MSEPLELRVYRVILFLVLICCLLSTRRRRVQETKALQEEISGLRHTVRHTRANLQEARSSTQQDRRVTEELMRFLRSSSSSQSPERLNEAESATLTPTTAEMNEFLRQVTRLKEEIQQCAERVSTTLHAQDPPLRYTPVPERTVGHGQRPTRAASRASHIPLPAQRHEALSAHPPVQTQRSVEETTSLPGPLRRPTLPRNALMLTERDLSAVTTQLYQIFIERNPEMPIQQARYYVRTLRNAMLSHIMVDTRERPVSATRRSVNESSAEMSRRNAAARERAADGFRGLGAAVNEILREAEHAFPDGSNAESEITESIPIHTLAGRSADAIESSPDTVSRRLSIELPQNFRQLLANGLSGAAHLASTSAHLNGEDTPDSVSSSGGGSSEATLVNNSSSEDLPVIHVILAPHSGHDDSGDETPAVEVHLPLDGSDGECG